MWNEGRGYYYGVLLGDGFYEEHPSNRSPYVMLKAADRDFVEHFAEVVSRLVGKKYAVCANSRAKGNCRAQWHCKCYHRPLVQESIEVTRGKTIIPNGVLMAERAVQIAFLQGLMDSEGWITCVLKPMGMGYMQLAFAVTAPWAKDVHRLFENLGVRATKIHVRNFPDRNGQPRKPLYSFNLHIGDYLSAGLGFNIKRKADRLAWCSRILTDYTRNYPRYADYYKRTG